jgi:spoIIIJ-associated protein
MGVKKAEIKARPRVTMDAGDLLNGNRKKAAAKKDALRQEEKPAKAPRKDEGKDERKDESKKEKKKAAPKREQKPRAPKPEPKAEPAREQAAPQAEAAPRAEAPAPERAPKPTPEPKEVMDEFADMDKAELEAIVREVTGKLLFPIVGETKLDVTFDPDRIKVFIDDEENSGLIIGREGQTLSSLQYLTNRLVSRRMETSVRIQIDTGEYRERQDEKLRQIAQHLADKASRNGRTQSTKPLSSYHRRVVHLALQDSENVFTRSKGDGPMKRVLIVPKRKNNRRNQRN